LLLPALPASYPLPAGTEPVQGSGIVVHRGIPRGHYARGNKSGARDQGVRGQGTDT